MLVGFGFGASLIALFMRVGGGIFTKAADVGADLVGKVEAGIPEDDPRNAATIADNVGDNVGDCAGMAADLFESYEITIIASLILGYSAFKSLHLPPARGLLYPLIVAGIGILTSAFGILIVRGRERDKSAMAPINRGFRAGTVLTLIGAFLVAEFYVHNLKVFWAVLIGILLANVASLITEHFTSTDRGPVQQIADSDPHRPGDNGAGGHLDRPRVERVGDHRNSRCHSQRGRSGWWQADRVALPRGACGHRNAFNDGDDHLGGLLWAGFDKRDRHCRDVR